MVGWLAAAAWFPFLWVVLVGCCQQPGSLCTRCFEHPWPSVGCGRLSCIAGRVRDALADRYLSIRPADAGLAEVNGLVSGEDGARFDQHHHRRTNAARPPGASLSAAKPMPAAGNIR